MHQELQYLTLTEAASANQHERSRPCCLELNRATFPGTSGYAQLPWIGLGFNAEYNEELLRLKTLPSPSRALNG